MMESPLINVLKTMNSPEKDRIRVLYGLGLGLCIMLVIVHLFVVNDFDYLNMKRGLDLILSGVNPWAIETRIDHFYNPPFSILFLWPMIFASPEIYIVVGGALIFGYLFYLRAWMAFAWFFTNTFLWIIAAGGIDMFIVGGGLLLLTIGDRVFNTWYGLILRVLGFGLLLVKPQGTLFIVFLFILMHKDWKGFLISLVIYGVPFLQLYPDWIRVLFLDPPLAQTVAAHSIWAKFGPVSALILAFFVIFARRWKYWQLGGVLAGILAPYGMPGLPILLTLTSVKRFRSAFVYVVFSGFLASLTWISPPEGVEFYVFSSHFMAIYHLSMLGLAISMACICDHVDDLDLMSKLPFLQTRLAQLTDSNERKFNLTTIRTEPALHKASLKNS